MVGMGCCVFHPLFVTGHARLVRLFFCLELVSATGGVTLDAVKLPGFDARAHSPERVGVVFTQVPAIRVEIRVLQCRQVVMVEEPIPGCEAGRQGVHLGVARSAVRVVLLSRKRLGPDDLEILGHGSFGSLPTHAVMLLARTMAGLTVDPGLGPGRMVGVGLEIVVCRELAHVATVAGRVKGVLLISPGDRLVRFATAWKVADTACCCIEPFLLPDIISQR